MYDCSWRLHPVSAQFARAYLFRQMMKVKNLAYSDTDSIICKDSAELFEQGEELGKWEKVCTMDNFHVAGKKLYAGQDVTSRDKEGNLTLEWVTAHKGFSALDTSHEDVIKVACGEAFIETEDGLEEGLRIMRSAPSINVTGRQSFINRKMRKT